MDAETFRNLPTAQVARLVHEAGPKVCVFPIKGTRRWFTMEHPAVPREDFASTYLNAITRHHIALYRLFFDHGVNTLLTPSFDKPLMERGDDYMAMAAKGLTQLATRPDFLSFYEAYKVRVRFYGDYHKFLGPTKYAYLLELFDEVTARTLANDRHRLFFGLFVHDATETVADLTVRHYIERGHVPDKRTLVEMYYGEYVEPVDLFIGFGKFRVFDMPLVATGKEDLYFTVSPSLYLTERQLRDILYDHLYTRIKTKADLSPDAWALMRDFYHANEGRTLGVGARQRHEVWHPLPQVELPDDFTDHANSQLKEGDNGSL